MAGKLTSAGTSSGSSSGGSKGTAGTPSTAGSSGAGVAGSANPSEGGSSGVAGEGSGGTGGAQGGSAGAGGSATKDDPRPGCAKVPGIELSNLKLVEGAGPGDTAKLEVDAKNGTDEFVDYNPVKIACTGDAVKTATDQLSVFGVSEGGMVTVELQVTFEDDAQPGDVASCTVRGFILGKSPEDCQNAQTLQLDVTVE
jgi:hypothetical protein